MGAAIHSFPRRRAWLAMAGVTVAVLAGCGLRFGPGVSIRYIVPHEYRGFLVTRWQCDGGERLPATDLGARAAITLPFGNDGTVCIADAIPAEGVRIDGYWYADGRRAPVMIGGTAAFQGAARPGEHELVVTYASLGIGDGRILGDECEFRDFLSRRFQVALSPPARCEPIYAQVNPATAGTPGSTATP